VPGMAVKKILIVEDEVIVSMVLEETIVKLGYQVVGTVVNGPDAIEKTGETRPDLVLMDIRLDGEMDGIEAAEKITALYNIPVVYLTAHSDEKTLDRAIKTQPYGYLIKPFRERELYTTIEMAINKHQAIQAERALLGYMIDATLRLKSPVELVRNDLCEILTQINDTNEVNDEIKMELMVQIKNTEQIVENLKKLNDTIIKGGKTVPESYKKFLTT
jgi:CheY-like chemotaxis protein